MARVERREQPRHSGQTPPEEINRLERADIGRETIDVAWYIWAAVDMLEYYEKKYLAATAYRWAMHYWRQLEYRRECLWYALDRLHAVCLP